MGSGGTSRMVTDDSETFTMDNLEPELDGKAYMWLSLNLRLLMSYIYGAPILDVSRSHTTTHTVGTTPLDE